MAKRILSLFRNLFRKRDIEQALDDELRSTLEVLTQEKIEQGLSQAAASREALIEIGGIAQVKEGVRAVRAGHCVEVFAWDIRYSLRRLYIIGDIGKILWVLIGGIGLVLLIASANVASLLLVRVESRQQELAIRAALGGSRGHIALSLLLESL
jgi:hypothetical protein